MTASRALARLRKRLLRALARGEGYPSVMLRRVTHRRAKVEHIAVVFRELVALEQVGLARSRPALHAKAQLDRRRRLFALTDAGARELAARRRRRGRACSR